MSVKINYYQYEGVHNTLDAWDSCIDVDGVGGGEIGRASCRERV